MHFLAPWHSIYNLLFETQSFVSFILFVKHNNSRHQKNKMPSDEGIKSNVLRSWNTEALKMQKRCYFTFFQWKRENQVLLQFPSFSQAIKYEIWHCNFMCESMYVCMVINHKKLHLRMQLLTFLWDVEKIVNWKIKKE